ncbi:MAG: OmpA family protein [Cellvibrionales bacterium]|nr:OmpA family protein [Cellvibrionales bacterium]
MKKHVNTILPKALGACVLATAATSQAAFWDASSWYIVPSVGYHYTDELDHYDKLKKKAMTEVEFDDGPIYGISFGWQTMGHSAVELAYNYSNFDIKSKPVGGGPETTNETTYHYLHLDHLYYFNDVYENDFSFYIPVGIGWMKNDPDVNKGQLNGKYYRGVEDTVLNFGVGAQYMFGEHVGVRGDVRGLYGFSQENFDAIAQVGLVVRWGMPVPMNVASAPPQSANLKFKLDSTELVNPNDPEIAVLINTLKNNPNSNVKILAYSDRSGNSAYNMRLSERRAESLKNILVNQHGIDADRIYTKAFGDQEGLSRARHAIAVVEH